MADLAGINELLDPLDLFGGQANRQASELQIKLGQMGLDLERDLFGTLREDEAPVRNVRNQALQFLRQLQSGEAQLGQDPSLPFQQQNIMEQIGKSSAAQGKSLAGGTRIAEQDALGALQSQSTNNQMNRLLNIAGFETGDLLQNNSLIAQNTDSQANIMGNMNALNNANRIGQSNGIFNIIGQGSQLAGSLIGNRGAG